MFRTRDLLLNPYPNAPSFHRMLAQEISEEMDVVNAALETGKPWGLEQLQLNYTPGQNTYTLNISDWGKALYVTRETGNPYLPLVNVPFDDVQTQHYGTVWNTYYDTFGSFCQPDNTIERMSFFREGVMNSQIKVTINPMPMQSWTYQITYLPSYIGTADPLEASIQLPEHAEMVRLRAALAHLPGAMWFEEEDKNMARRQQLRDAFLFQLKRKERLFNKYLKSIAIPKTVTLGGWNDWA